MDDLSVMGHKVPRERVLGNFKTPRGPKKKQPKPHKKKTERARDRRPGMSPLHLKIIVKLPCCVSGITHNIDPHHLRQHTGERGMNLRATDKFTVPLYHDLHFYSLHKLGSQHEEAWFAERGVNPWDLANALWKASPDFRNMQAIMKEHLRSIGL